MMTLQATYFIDSLTARIGPRFALVGEAGRAREDMEVSTA